MAFGINKRVERVRKSLHEAFVSKANELTETNTPHAALRAFVMMDIADVIKSVGVEAETGNDNGDT